MFKEFQGEVLYDGILVYARTWYWLVYWCSNNH